MEYERQPEEREKSRLKNWLDSYPGRAYIDRFGSDLKDPKVLQFAREMEDLERLVPVMQDLQKTLQQENGPALGEMRNYFGATPSVIFQAQQTCKEHFRTRLDQLLPEGIAKEFIYPTGLEGYFLRHQEPLDDLLQNTLSMLANSLPLVSLPRMVREMRQQMLAVQPELIASFLSREDIADLTADFMTRHLLHEVVTDSDASLRTKDMLQHMSDLFQDCKKLLAHRVQALVGLAQNDPEVALHTYIKDHDSLILHPEMVVSGRAEGVYVMIKRLRGGETRKNSGKVRYSRFEAHREPKFPILQELEEGEMLLVKMPANQSDIYSLGSTLRMDLRPLEHPEDYALRVIEFVSYVEKEQQGEQPVTSPMDPSALIPFQLLLDETEDGSVEEVGEEWLPTSNMEFSLWMRQLGKVGFDIFDPSQISFHVVKGDRQLVVDMQRGEVRLQNADDTFVFISTCP